MKNATNKQRMQKRIKATSNAWNRLHAARMAFVKAHEALTPEERKELNLTNDAWRDFGDFGA